MREALKEAAFAFDAQEVPVGAVAVYNDTIVARAHNQIQSSRDPLRHAEIVALNKTRQLLQQKWLEDVALYVTVEPCVFCAGALVLSRVKRVVFGADEKRTGAFGSRVQINDLGLNHAIAYTSGVCKDECAALMQAFFTGLRRDNQKKPGHKYR